MANEKAANADEGAGPEKDVEQGAGKKTHGGVEAHMSPTHNLDIDIAGEDGGGDESRELKRTHDHADPSKGSKPADNGEKISEDHGNEAPNPGN
jgi:hypothetical protein